jgi:osmotically-inducible protein OsmY
MRITLLTLFLLAPLARGIEPPAAGRVSDAELTRRVQTVLQTDAVLKARSLIVSVVDGVAVVGGPVASRDESDRIGQLLRVVPDLTDVKVSAWVPAVEDPLKKKIAEKFRGVEQPTRAPAADPRPSGQVVVQRAAPAAPAVPLLQDPVARSEKPLPSRAASGYSPIPAPAPPAPEGPPQYPTIPPTAVPVAPNQDVEAAIEDVQRGQTRFAGLTARVRAGVVTIDGTVNDPEDGWAFAAEVRKVPGVDRVVLGRITAP